MQRRMLAVATLAALSVAGPVAAAQGAASKSKVTQGVVYGAVTSQGYPVTIKLSKTGRKVVRATIGIDLKCQIPPDITLPDDVKNIAVSAAGKFTAEQAPERITTAGDPAQGIPPITLEVSAKLTGQVNKARTRIKGTWQRKVVIFNPADPTGVAIADTCDSGVLKFTAEN
jgi:hypothetical protein